MQLIGLARLGRDAELRSTTAGDPVATLSLAYNFGKKGSDGKKPTQWVEAALWGARAEALTPHLAKGTLLCVSLEDVHIETFESRGETRSKLVGKVTSLEFAGAPPERAAAPAPAPAPAPRPAPRPAPAPAPRPAARTTSTGFDDMDDDIPF